MAITDYTTLVAALSDWSESSNGYSADEVIGLAEAEFRIYFGPNYVKDTSTTLTVTSGVATLPSGFIRPISLTHSTYGAIDQRLMDAVRERRIFDASGIPGIYAIEGNTVQVAPLYTGDLTFDYEGTLTGLSGSNATNWLITNAPQAYLSMCLYFIKAREEDPNAINYKQSSLATLNDLGFQAQVAQMARAGVKLHGVTP